MTRSLLSHLRNPDSVVHKEKDLTLYAFLSNLSESRCVAAGPRVAEGSVALSGVPF